MKKLIVVIVVIFALLANYALRRPAGERFSLEDTTRIVISSGYFDKAITDLVDITSIIPLLNEVKLKPIKDDVELTSSEVSLYEFILYDSEENVVNSISFVGNMVYFNGGWYWVEEELVEQIEDIYQQLEILKEENPLAKEIDIRRALRSGLGEIDALKGTWVSYNDMKLHFDESIIREGANEFHYTILEESENYLALAVYGLEGFLIKNRKLYDMYIIFDDSKSNAQINKVVKQLGSNDLIYQYNMVYLDKEENLLGRFNDLFFARNHH